VNTVKAYNKSLYRKLGVTSRHEAVGAARRLGLI
jgi:LuxR family transcriptional regulator, maltose regulon positive regulatory protein